MQRKLFAVFVGSLLISCLLAASPRESAAASVLNLEEMSLVRGGYRCKSYTCGVKYVPCNANPGGMCWPNEPDYLCDTISITPQTVQYCLTAPTGTSCNPGPAKPCGHRNQCVCLAEECFIRDANPSTYQYNPCN